jgi:VanZ family protein
MKKLSWVSLRNKKPRVYVFLSFYVFLSAFLVVESCFPGNISYEQSGTLGDVVASLLNLFTGNTPAQMVEPTALTLSADSTYLSEVDERPQIGIGTTTRLAFSVSAGTLGKGDYIDPSFTVERSDDTADQGLYNLLVDASSDTVSIVSIGKAQAGCSIAVKAGDNLSASYAFDIVDLSAPPADFYAVQAPALTLQQKESETLEVILADSVKNKSDLYLRRYYDLTKLNFSSSNPNVATIDKYGVIRGMAAGNASITFGKESFDITVQGAGTPADNTTKLTLAKSDAASVLALNDYDFATENGINDTGVTLKPTFSGTLPSDESITWRVLDSDGAEDALQAKLIPHTDGTVSVFGYRKKGTATILATANCDASLQQSIDLPLEEIKPLSMSLYEGSVLLSPTGETIAVGDVNNAGDLTIKGSFMGADSNPNVTNCNLLATSNNSNLVISGSGSSAVTFYFIGEGEAEATISSAANPELFFTLTFRINVAPNVDPNDTSFQTFIRKSIGHFALFALTALCGFLFLAFLLEDQHRWIAFLLGTGWGLLLASITELIQHFVPGRYGGWEDIGIDMLGYVFGSLICRGAFELIILIDSRKKIKTSNPHK